MTNRRKLSAIVSADAAGYSRLMSDDEAATLRSLNDARAVFRERIKAHGGQLIDTAGDSILAEFPSAVEAVDCAAEIQHELAKRNSQLAEHRRMQFRIGINLGDVIEQEDGTIYGDGVNVAARLQQLAEPGGICVSGTAFDQVEGKLPLQSKFIGEQQVKNIAKPVRVYRVIAGTATSGRRGASPRRLFTIGATNSPPERERPAWAPMNACFIAMPIGGESLLRCTSRLAIVWNARYDLTHVTLKHGLHWRECMWKSIRRVSIRSRTLSGAQSLRRSAQWNLTHAANSHT